MITDAQIREWEEACEGLPPDEWVQVGTVVWFRRTDEVSNSIALLDKNKARFIIAARTALPLLLAERRRWEEGLDAVEDRLTVEDELPCNGWSLAAVVRNLRADRTWDGKEVG